ncbi:hypothetical protein NDU88_012245 [Pleurodeles waltl]|uniref:Uncharacterized protein n=1 Tax=Pleurodeles waltl TaxID=8319 RepID=A0AAV7QZL0_PLEWA|nr:hypothetical protein NDU88_012245 [Pleurodeles waltl]
MEEEAVRGASQASEAPKPRSLPAVNAEGYARRRRRRPAARRHIREVSFSETRETSSEATRKDASSDLHPAANDYIPRVSHVVEKVDANLAIQVSLLDGNIQVSLLVLEDTSKPDVKMHTDLTGVVLHIT